MEYKEFKGLKLSTLGFGAMRLPQVESTKEIDEDRAIEMIEHAYNNGVNYFDTAFFYHAGKSESILRKALAKFPRDTWYIADKFPGNMIDVIDGKLFFDAEWAGMEKVTYNNLAEIFERQLENCGVDYFDFYLLHNVAESTYDTYADENLGIVSYLLEQKKAGRIKHLGISSHGRYETIDKFLNHYDCIDFVMIQLNYLDWSLQEGGRKYDVATKHGLPIMVMEPVRGGLLASPGEEAEALLKASRPNDSPAKWAFRFLQSLPNIQVVISGMSTMEQIKENIEIFSNKDIMPESEKAVLQSVVDGMASFVPCTTCRYCCGVCPKELDIPMLIATYNEAAREVTWYVEGVLEALADDKKPQSCTGCGACSPLCPQNIDIADTMKKFNEVLAAKSD